MFPLRVQSASAQAWKEFHENMAVDAVLNNRLNDLKALIDNDFVAKVYENYWHYMDAELRKLSEIRICAEERRQAIETWGNAGGLNSQEELLKNARQLAYDGLMGEFEAALGQYDGLKGNEETQRMADYSQALQAILDKNIVGNDKNIALVDFPAELARLDKIMADTDKKEAELGKKKEELDKYLRPLAVHEGEPLERYFAFLSAHLDVKAKLDSSEATKVDANVLAKHREEVKKLIGGYEMPEPYRSAIKALTEAKNLSELVQAGFKVESGTLNREREFNNEIAAVGTTQKKKDKAIFDKAELLKETKMGIFKDGFCADHYVSISPDFLLPQSPGTSLLEVALKRKSYFTATWLLLNGAHVYHKNNAGEVTMSLLTKDKVADIARLAVKIFDLQTRMGSEKEADTPLAIAEAYKTAREENYSQTHVLDKPRMMLNTNVNDAFHLRSQKLLRKVTKKLIQQQGILARTQQAQGTWDTFISKLELLVNLGNKAVQDMDTQLSAIRIQLIEAKEQLQKVDAVGHHEHFVDKLALLSQKASSVKGYDDLVADMKEIKTQFRDIETFGRKANDQQNMAVIEQMMETTAKLAQELAEQQRKREEAEKLAQQLKETLEASLKTQDQMKKRDEEREKETQALLEDQKRRDAAFEAYKAEQAKQNAATAAALAKLQAKIDSNPPERQERSNYTYF